jgi:hypothetical protein
MKFFQVKVQFSSEDDKGKTKKQNVSYLVDAETVTEAEARTIQYLVERGEEAFEVKSAVGSAIAEVIDREESLA